MPVIQNRAMRIILNAEYDSSRETMLRSLNFLSISQLIKLNVMIYIYKMLNGLLPKYLINNLIFTRNVSERITRQYNINLLRLPNFKYENSRRNIFFYGIKMYNELPNDIKNSQNLKLFKKNCKEFIIQNFVI